MRKRLAKYDIPGPIMDRWEKRFGGRLLPLQYRAIDEFGLLEYESLLISAPTSSGKTFCGEMALARAVLQRRKGIFLVPLKAVAEEKYRQFSDCYGEAGLRVVVGTRDHPENDAAITNGRFDIAVMVYEKLNSLLLTNFDLMGRVGALVVDEIQMLADGRRGAQLEMALTKLRYSRYRPQIIALSAVLGDATALADWLGCRLLLESGRPVELRRGVASDGTFYYRCHNSGVIGEEAVKKGEDNTQVLFENIRQALAAGSQVLVFLKSRQETVRAALRFAEYAAMSPEAENHAFAMESLADEEPSTLHDTLCDLITRGLAFHNADLTAGQRHAVEEGARAALIKVIFATTTLATGINLPAGIVFIEPQKYRQQGYGGRTELQPLSWAEYENMSGRAGRVGYEGDGQEPARAVLLAASDLEKSILWDYYVEHRAEPLASQLPVQAAGDIVVDLFSSGLAHGPDDCAKILARSYHAGSDISSLKITDETFQELLDGGFIVRDDAGWLATPMGKAAAVSGLTAAGTRYIINLHPSITSGSDMQIIYRFLHSPEGQEIYLPGSGRHRRQAAGLVPADGREDDPLLAELTALRRELTPEEVNRLRLTFLLIDWMAGMETLDVERKYSLHLGMIDTLARQAGWLFASAAAVIRAHDRFSSFPRQLEEIAFSAAHGLPVSLKPLHDELGGLMFRGELLRLHREGIADIDQLRAADGILSGIVVSSEKRLLAIEKRLNKAKEDNMLSIREQVSESAGTPQMIEIEGTPIRERYLVRIDGRPITLTGKSFKYLVSLVWSRLTKDTGWVYKDELEQGYNQARYLYRLRQEIGRDFLPQWPLYENNRSGYYRLVADRGQIKVNLDALKEIPDYEIQRMVADLRPVVAD
ncbi:MAG: DEAD/DEAH box helicase [candidate division Zixibacteria bacterium]|nr:DEAD/DEAH box helicase [candidate division Zixibacteria bacterium]